MKYSIISICLLFALCIQLVPATGSNSSICFAPFTEETPCNSDGAETGEEINAAKHYNCTEAGFHLRLVETVSLQIIHHATELYHCFHEDVQIQPPDNRLA